MADDEWKTQVDKALSVDDPEDYSLFGKKERLVGHSVFARLSSDNPLEIEVVAPSLEPKKPNQLRLLLTHRIPDRKSGEHVIVIGMNPSKARAFSGSVQSKELGDNMPETDSTAKVVRGWLENAELAQAKRLTMINLLPIVETDSQKVPQLLHEYSRIDFQQIFHQLLQISLTDEHGKPIKARIICAWGKPKGRDWVREGAQWFQEFCTSPDNKVLLEGIQIYRLKYSRGEHIPDYPPHPNQNLSLRHGKNTLMDFSLENQ